MKYPLNMQPSFTSILPKYGDAKITQFSRKMSKGPVIRDYWSLIL